MATGDGWAVYRYKCPKCSKKGLIWDSSQQHECMTRAWFNETGTHANYVLRCLYCMEKSSSNEAGIEGRPLWKASRK